ncbi:MAG: hypothetical protein HDR05_12650 [Lachnospiraceae bacterium]|nr:hypothetical protein [Lachnospiraceae bacterium]
MAIKEIGVSGKRDTSIVLENASIKIINTYQCVETGNQGIFKVVDNRGGYIVRLDYGRILKLDKGTNTFKLKQDKTIRHVDTEREAKQLRREAEEIRIKRKKGELLDSSNSKIIKITMEKVISDFKKSTRYNELGDSYKDHYDNYLRHILSYFKDFEPSKVTTIDIENYFNYQRTRGNLSTAKKKDGTVNKKMVSKYNEKGISVNTLRKHKTALKTLWEYMIDSKCYGVTINVVNTARMPRETVLIDGKEVKVAVVKYKPRSLTLEELNYTLNDAIQNEYDRSIAAMIALGSIGGLRCSEVVGLKIGKFKHNELMEISDGSFDYSGYDRQYYEEHEELMLIDEAVMRIQGKNVLKLPKCERIRIAAIPNSLHNIIDYAMEQREEILNLVNREISSSEQLYLPLINIIKQRELNSAKLGRKWSEYQERRNKRMEKAGLKPIPIIRFHDLRHTHSNLLRIEVPSWERSFNMGHTVPDAMNTTTDKDYLNDRQPYRQHIINYFDNNIKIDWSKAQRKHVNDKDCLLHVNNSGHLVIKDEHKERVKQLRKRLVLSENEMVEMMYSDNPVFEQQA